MTARFPLALAAALILACGIGHAQELKLSTALGPAFPLGKAGERWAQP